VKLGTVIKSVPGPLPADWRTVEALFDHMPDTVFFVKDAEGRYAAVNATLVKRCGLRFKSELLGRRPADIFPGELGHQPTAQDRRVLKTGRPILDRLELHWYPTGRRGWCLTTKLPLRDHEQRVIGLVGISKDLQAPDEQGDDFSAVAVALRHLQRNFAEPLRVGDLAALAKQSPYQFERRIRRIFRLTTGQLIQKTRIETALRLLRETAHPIARVAQDCGYSDQSAFTRTFRRMVGLSPSGYRSANLAARTP